MSHRKKIFNLLKPKIRKIFQETGSCLSRPGKDDTFYEKLAIVLQNGDKKTFFRKSGFNPTSTSWNEIKIEDFPFYEHVFYNVTEWICEKYHLNEIMQMLKHLKAFENGLSIKNRKIYELKREIERITKHLDKNLFYWGFVENITSYEIDRNYDQYITEINYTNGEKEKIVGGTPGVSIFNKYEFIDSNMCHYFETSFLSNLKWKQKISIPVEFDID